MITLKCPNCNSIIDVRSNNGNNICRNCLNNHGKSFIMVESSNNSKPRNIGDGFFELPNKGE